jgi:hypothetical protein
LSPQHIGNRDRAAGAPDESTAFLGASRFIELPNIQLDYPRGRRSGKWELLPGGRLTAEAPRREGTRDRKFPEGHEQENDSRMDVRWVGAGRTGQFLRNRRLKVMFAPLRK